MTENAQINPEVPSDNSAAGIVSAPGKVPSITSSTYCPYRQSELLQQALAPDKMRVAFLLGAGCPMAIEIPDSDGMKPLIPDIRGLTNKIRHELQEPNDHKDTFEGILKRLDDMGIKEPNLEEILSHVRALLDVIGNGTIDGISKDALINLDEKLCNLTTSVVSVGLPSDSTPYHHLATWIKGIRRTHSVEIFTPNYDLLMEQALEERRVPYFDGFVGSRRTFFDLSAMEQDILPARWARLWKIHGSVNWWRMPTGEITRSDNPVSDSRQMIYPSHLKYDQSRRMPYLAMLDRLRDFLAQGQAVLVTCGYSFSDLHLNDVILQGLGSNPTAICFGLLFGDRNKSPEATARARKQPNLSLLAADGAVLGTIERDWLTGEKTGASLHGLAAKAGDMMSRTEAPADRCKFLLGDFKSFGDFLARQLSSSEGGKGYSDAE